MDTRGNGYIKRNGSVKPALNLYEESYSPFKKTLRNDSEKPSPRKKELHSTRRDTSQFRENTKNAEAAKARAESELCGAKKTVKDLALRIEESNARVKKIEELERQKTAKGCEEHVRPSPSKTEEDQYAEVIRELEYVKQEISKLKADMAFVMEGKKRAEKETDAASSKVQSYASSVEAYKKEIDQLNEEHVLVELARMEALKEYGEIEVARKVGADHYSSLLEGMRKKVNDLNDLIEKTDSTEELETKLSATNSDVNMLKNELSIVKATQGGLNPPEDEDEEEEDSNPTFLKVISEELEAAKKELASINEDGLQFTTSMDVIRDEVKHLSQEIARLKKTEENADSTIQSLNSKLLRAKSKLEAVSAAEEKANSILSGLSAALEQIKTEAEAAKRERELIGEDTAKMNAELPKIESEIDIAKAKLEAAILELTEVKSREADALENLKAIVESSVRARASSSRQSSTITISTFEYEYLKGCAHGAEEIADKKVAAAQAWIEALKASEKEILMKTEITKREIREQKVLDEHKAQKEERMPSKRMSEKEEHNWARKKDIILEAENLQLAFASPRKSINKDGISTPTMRTKFRKSTSSAGWNVSKSNSAVVDRRKKGRPDLARLFSNKSIEGAH